LRHRAKIAAIKAVGNAIAKHEIFSSPQGTAIVPLRKLVSGAVTRLSVSKEMAVDPEVPAAIAGRITWYRREVLENGIVIWSARS
jgi:hypothetical protein